MKYLIILLAIIIMAGFGFFFLNNRETNPPTENRDLKVNSTPAASEDVEYEARFAIYTNGTFRIFTDPKYHNLSMDVYIESENPNKIIVRKNGITWADFFKTLPMKLDKNCLITGTGQVFCSNGSSSLKFFINGESNKDALDEEIRDGDKLLVSFGPKDDPNILIQLDKLKEGVIR